MAAQHRSNPKTHETYYRVYRLPEGLRKQVHEVRRRRQQTVQQFLVEAMELGLPRIERALTEAGIVQVGADARPAKLPMNQEMLTQLRRVGETTGLPQTVLLLGCLRLSASRKRRCAKRQAQS